ncbi:unnamed protein product [Angiostrongylus costaricensis]|uniref:BatC protein n=1 Tax=Angiostrongylus costaricensis TaxID=334426 RepID=A0A0R3PP39_ANGCS|nr:unnamed protein product [Angiostrongylus costaricensis]
MTEKSEQGGTAGGTTQPEGADDKDEKKELDGTGAGTTGGGTAGGGSTMGGATAGDGGTTTGRNFSPAFQGQLPIYH